MHRISWSARKALRFAFSPFALLKVLFSRRRTYDVVHLHQFSWFGVLVIGVARLLGKPVLTKLPNVAEHGLPGLAASRFGAFKVAIFKRSDAVVAMSRQSLDELEAIGFPLSRVLCHTQWHLDVGRGTQPGWQIPWHCAMPRRIRRSPECGEAD